MILVLLLAGSIPGVAACLAIMDPWQLGGGTGTSAGDGGDDATDGSLGADGSSGSEAGSDAGCVGPAPDPTLLSDAVRITLGNGFGCAVRHDGTVACWGQYYRGQFGFAPDSGDPSVSHSATPVVVAGLAKIQDLAAGDSHTCAVDNQGHVWCWGFNNGGQLGNGQDLSDGAPPSSDPSPGMVHYKGQSLGSAISVSSGLDHSCALISGGLVACWGNNANGDLGLPRDAGAGEGGIVTSAKLSSVGGGGGATQVAAGNRCSCAVITGTSSSLVQCCGANANNELGADPGDAGLPVTMPLPANAQSPVAVTTSFYFSDHLLVLDDAGKVFGSGDNSQGALGSFSSGIPAVVPGLSGGGVTQIATGPTHTCALMADGTVQCIGRNTYGELGRGYTSTPVIGDADYVEAPSATGAGEAGPGDASDGTRLTGVLEIAAGWEQSCALVRNACRSDGTGTVYCWGWNGIGQLGDGTTVSRDRPVPVLAPH